jgi:hypothetical protein
VGVIAVIAGLAMESYASGATLLLLGILFFAVAMPNKWWGRPRFLDSALAMAFYPGLVVALIVFGAAELLLGFQGR